jgi:Ice-binding-like
MFLTLLISASLAACGGGTSTAIPSGASNGPAPMAVADARAPRSIGAAYVFLGFAGNFTVLAGSTVTNSGPTDISGINGLRAPCGARCGNVGIWPGTAMTGFPPGVIKGYIYAGVPVALHGQADLTKAYNFAMGEVLHPVSVAGNLGGRTLAPGLYKSTSSLAVSSGNLTLDGGGKSNACWVFQMASTFTMTTGRKIILTNGANAGNIFWAVGSSATLGTGADFYGNILSHQSISVGTGAVVHGRLLARVGAVTLLSNTIVRPAY